MKSLMQEADLDPGEVSAALLALALIENGEDREDLGPTTRAVIDKVYQAWLRTCER